MQTNQNILNFILKLKSVYANYIWENEIKKELILIASEFLQEDNATFKNVIETMQIKISAGHYKKADLENTYIRIDNLLDFIIKNLI